MTLSRGNRIEQRGSFFTTEDIKATLPITFIVEALGLEGAIRVSPLHCHGKDDIDRFLKITQEIAEQFAK